MYNTKLNQNKVNLKLSNFVVHKQRVLPELLNSRILRLTANSDLDCIISIRSCQLAKEFDASRPLPCTLLRSKLWFPQVHKDKMI